MKQRTVLEAAFDWGVSASTVRYWCNDGVIRAHKQGRDWVVTSLNPPPPSHLGRKRAGEAKEVRE